MNSHGRALDKGAPKGHFHTSNPTTPLGEHTPARQDPLGIVQIRKALWAWLGMRVRLRRSGVAKFDHGLILTGEEVTPPSRARNNIGQTMSRQEKRKNRMDGNNAQTDLTAAPLRCGNIRTNPCNFNTLPAPSLRLLLETILMFPPLDPVAQQIEPATATYICSFPAPIRLSKPMYSLPTLPSIDPAVVCFPSSFILVIVDTAKDASVTEQGRLREPKTTALSFQHHKYITKDVQTSFRLYSP